MKRTGATITYETSSVSTASERLQRHIASLGLADTSAYRAWCRAHGFGSGLNKSWRDRHSEKSCADRLAAAERDRAKLTAHIQLIGMRETSDYAAWCRETGRRVSLHRSARQLARERREARACLGDAALVEATRVRRDREAFIRALLDGSILKRELRSEVERQFVDLMREIKPTKSVQAALVRLIVAFGADLALIIHGHRRRGGRPRCGRSLLGAMLQIANHSSKWLSNPESWKPPSGSPRRRFGSLLRHLFARFPVPAFMDNCWFGSDHLRVDQHLKWYLHVAAGNSLRTADVPVKLTRKMTHFAMLSPRRRNIEPAIRWGQVRGSGGSFRLARTIIRTRLGCLQPDEPFWATVVQFFVNSPMLDPARIDTVVDFIYDQRFVAVDRYDLAGEVIAREPPQPAFSMKGRSATVLVQLAEQWTKDEERSAKGAREWARTGIECYRESRESQSAVGGEETWVVSEILTVRALHQEGRYMSNCVATYAHSCSTGECSIWSLRKHAAWDLPGVRVATIEMSRRREIVQVRGRFNTVAEDPDASADLKAVPALLVRWASASGLTISSTAW